MNREEFGVPNENGKGVDDCTEKGLAIGNTYFKHKCILVYNKASSGTEEREFKSMVTVKRDTAICAQCDDSERNGTRDRRSLLCKMKLVGTIIRREEVDRAERIGSAMMIEQQYKE